MDVALIITLRDWSKRTTVALRDCSQQAPGDVLDLVSTLIEAHADLARLLDRLVSAERQATKGA